MVACTVQKDKLKSKILADLAGICADGAATVEIVVFFSVYSVPEAATHELQRTARETYGVTLEVLSGIKVAAMLAEPDLVWIAQHFLEVPSGMIPQQEYDSTPDWYRELRDNLRRNEGPAALTPASQGEIARAIRFATWDEVANADLPEWLEYMSAFLANDVVNSERDFRASYAIAVARFRGTGMMSGVDDLIRRAMSFALITERADILDDATTLVMYWGSMWSEGVAEADSAEITESVERLRMHVEAELRATDSSTHPVRTATLTGMLVRLYLQPSLVRLEQQRGLPEPACVASMVGVRLDEMPVDTSHLIDGDLIDLTNVMHYFSELVEVLPNARPYPVTSISQTFSMFAPALSSQPNYGNVRDKLDAAVELATGDAAAAARCRDRGSAFLDAGKPLEALNELHKAKVKWFHGDSMYGSVLILRVISDIYRDLGLTYAAKMYACSAAVMANQSSDDDLKAQLPKALLLAARIAQETGCWADAAYLTEIALLAHHSHSTDPNDYSKHPELETHEMNELMELAAVHTFWPHLMPLFEAAHAQTGLYAHLANQLANPENGMPFSEEQFQALAREQFAGPIFADLGPDRVIDFSALGTRWTFSFQNNHTTVLTAEGFIAAFQVLLADLARLNPILIKATVRTTIKTVSDRADEEVSIDDPGVEMIAEVTLCHNTSEFKENAQTLLATAVQLISSVHVGPPGEIRDHFDSMMQEGIWHKVTVARPYSDSADLLPDEHYGHCATLHRPVSSMAFTPIENAHLTASTIDGPRYDRVDSMERIFQRYTVAGESLKYSLPGLLADEHVKRAITDLQAGGWLDWQILAVFVNIEFNLRMVREGVTYESSSPQQLRELATRSEDPDDPRLTPEHVLDQIPFGLALLTAAVAQNWGVRAVSEKLGDDVIRDVLVRQYHYSEDDIPHRPLLDCFSEGGSLLPLVDS
ncbi:MAG: hypothetical protein EON58_07745 [Alphaproteobacteria bacterium]|nr:MAG: hypothetical protein EON58_07745 [Alphaproteobacteria bacterium]